MILALLVGATVTIGVAEAQAPNTLRGSRASMLEQNGVARQHDFTFLQTPAQVRNFVSAGYLVPLSGNRDYVLNGIAYPYVRPEARLFVERLGAQYHAMCGEWLLLLLRGRETSNHETHHHSRSTQPGWLWIYGFLQGGVERG